LIVQGVTLTVVGMAIVFLFLILLVFVMKLLAEIVKKLLPLLGLEVGPADKEISGFPELQEEKGTPEIAAIIAGIHRCFPGTFRARTDEVAAVVAAAHQYRQQNTQQT